MRSLTVNENTLHAPAQQPADDRVQRPQRGDELELTIDSLAFGGEGVARLGDGGYVVFVAGAIPGDRVRAVVHKRKRSYAHARTLEVLEPSPERIAPRARHPGVPWQVLPYERQLEIKQGQVDEALRRIGHLGGYELQEIVPALEQWRYRNKLEYSFGGGEEHGGELVCGFHASAGGRGVEQIEDCLLASEQGNRVREVALRWCREQRLSAWDRGFGVGGQDAPEVEASAARAVFSTRAPPHRRCCSMRLSARMPVGRAAPVASIAILARATVLRVAMAAPMSPARSHRWDTT
jgi:23S rRNA (uracil1939-C5)-methyltransferase